MPETAVGRFRWTIGALLFLRHQSESCPADPGRPGALQSAADRAPMESPRGKVADQTGFFNRRRARRTPIPARISSDEPGSGVPVEVPPVAVTLSMYSKGVVPGLP